MFSREIIHMYKTGEADPQLQLSRMMKESEAQNEASSDNSDSNTTKKHRPKLPNLASSKKRKDSNKAEAAN